MKFARDVNLNFPEPDNITKSISHPQSTNQLNVMSYNIQVGMNSVQMHHYITHSWKHIIPHNQRIVNMNHIANVVQEYDIVGLQEVDAGSLRSNFINLTEYLAQRSQFPYWYHQVNRNFGRFAKHSNGLLSRFRPYEIQNLKLPGIIPGRRVIMAKYKTSSDPIVFFILHLALGGRARLNQLSFVAEHVQQYKHTVVMGDMNCRPSSTEMTMFFKRTHMREPAEEILTFPSWRPKHNIDHILVSSELQISHLQVNLQKLSDHLPISLKITLPDTMQLLNSEP